MSALQLPIVTGNLGSPRPSSGALKGLRDPQKQAHEAEKEEID